MVAPAGAGPWPQMISGFPFRTSKRITGTSPPGPFRCGSTTCSVNAVATAASNALPPLSRMPMPTAVAIQWVEATTPKVPSISGRVVNGFGLMLAAMSGTSRAVFLWLRGAVQHSRHRKPRSPWMPAMQLPQPALQKPGPAKTGVLSPTCACGPVRIGPSTRAPFPLHLLHFASGYVAGRIAGGPRAEERPRNEQGTTGGTRMRLGYFTMPVHPLHRSWTETLKEDRAAIILADKLGFHDAFVGEHLTDKAENVTNSMTFLATLIPETKQIKLGTGTANLAQKHPVLIASQAAMFDHLAEGRFILGVSPGALVSDAEALGMSGEDKNKLFAEA